MKKRQFLLNALKQPLKTGTFLPSQKFLIQKMIAPIDAKRCKCVAEFGAGDGCITQKLRKKLPPACLLLSFEINKKLLGNKRLHSRSSKDIVFVQDDVVHLEKYLQQYHVQELDYIVSSLPLAFIPKDKMMQILQIANKYLKHDGLFIQYQYSPASLRSVRQVFSDVDVQFTPLNLPPAFVYVCRK